MEYTECVADTAAVLTGLAEIANVPFTKSEFSRFEADFVNSKEQQARYTLKGNKLTISVLLEQYEGYFFVSVSGSGDCFEQAKNYLISNSK